MDSKRDEMLKIAENPKMLKELEQLEEKLMQVADKHYELKMDKEAYRYYIHCLEIHRLIFPTINEKTAHLLNQIGVCHRHLKNHDTSLKYFQVSLDLFKRLPHSEYSMAVVLENKALAFFYKGMFDEALKLSKESLKLYEGLVPISNEALVIAKYNIGTTYEKLNRYSEALDWYKQSFEINMTLLPKDHKFLARCLCSMGQMCLKIEKNEDALDYLKQALKESMQMEDSKEGTFVDFIKRNIETAYKKIVDLKETSKISPNSSKMLRPCPNFLFVFGASNSFE